MTEKTLPKGHVSTLTPDEIRQSLDRIRRGSVDGGVTLPTREISAEPFDARTATPDELAAKAKEMGLRITKNL